MPITQRLDSRRGNPPLDVIIVGAGTAGTASAMLLARRGWRVLLLSARRRHPDGLATEVLTRAGVLQLSRWGLLDKIIASGTPPVRRTTFRYPDDVVDISVKPSLGVDALYAPPSEVLREALLHAAIDAGVDVRHRTEVTEVIVTDGRVTGVRAVGADGVADLRASLVVGADGTGSTIAQYVGAGLSTVGHQASTVIHGYWSALPADSYDWHIRRDSRVGIIPTNEGRACVFLSGPAGRVRRGGPDVVSQAIAAGSPQVADLLNAGSPPHTVRTWRAGRGFVRHSHGPGWALVGTAGFFKDPTSAHGLTDSLRDAELLAGCVTRGLDGKSTLDAALSDYEATRDRIGLPIFEAVERIASHRWEDNEISPLLQQLSSAMADEAELLAQLDGDGTA